MCVCVGLCVSSSSSAQHSTQTHLLTWPFYINLKKKKKIIFINVRFQGVLFLVFIGKSCETNIIYD